MHVHWLAADGRYVKDVCWPEGRQSAGKGDRQCTVGDEDGCHGARSSSAPGQRFFSEDKPGERSHGRDVHHAECEENDKQKPAATQAPKAMEQAYSQGTDIPVTP